MAGNIFQRRGPSGEELHVWRDPIVILEADLQAQLPVLQELRALSDEARVQIAASGLPTLGIQAQPDLESLDDFLDTEIDRIRDVLDYFNDYSVVTAEIPTAFEGAWYTPEAVESFTDDDGNVAANAIDDNLGTFWQSVSSGPRQITVRLRDYRKRMERIRLRVPSAGMREELQDVTIRIATMLPALDLPQNIVDTGVDFDYAGNAWVEHTFSTPVYARYLRLETAGSSQGDPIRIREMDIWVGVQPHNV